MQFPMSILFISLCFVGYNWKNNIFMLNPVQEKVPLEIHMQ